MQNKAAHHAASADDAALFEDDPSTRSVMPLPPVIIEPTPLPALAPTHPALLLAPTFPSPRPPPSPESEAPTLDESTRDGDTNARAQATLPPWRKVKRARTVRRVLRTIAMLAPVAVFAVFGLRALLPKAATPRTPHTIETASLKTIETTSTSSWTVSRPTPKKMKSNAKKTKTHRT